RFAHAMGLCVPTKGPRMVAAMAKVAREFQKGEVDPLDLELPYEPVALPMESAAPGTARVTPISNQLYTGDALETMMQWDDKSCHACITDPPYNIARDRKGLAWAFSSHVTIDSEWDRFSHEEYEEFTTAWLKEVCRLVKENGNIFIFGS